MPLAPLTIDMATTPRSTVVGVFHDIEDARDAVTSLKDAGFNANDIGLLAHDRDRGREVAEETGTRSHAGEGAATGLVAGGILGGIGGWLVGIGALAIPGVGPFIAAGAIGAALTGAAVGAGVGAIAGALIGMGVPEDEAKYYEGEVRGGRTLVTVQANGHYDEAREILRDHGAYDIEDRDTDRSMTRPTTTATGTAVDDDYTTRRGSAYGTGSETDQARLQLREEELRAQKRPVETGRVTVGKDVVEQERTMNVPVTREDVTIERRPVERRTSDRPIDEDGETVEVPVREERVDVEKRPVVYEEAEVGKRAVTENQRVTDTVRREEARVEREGDVNVPDSTTPRTPPRE